MYIIFEFSVQQQQQQQSFYAPCLELLGWAGTRTNIHPLTPILIINHPFSASSIYYDLQHPPCAIYVPDTHFVPPLFRSSLVYLLVWNPPLHTSYASSITVFFSQHMPILSQPVLLRLYHLILVCLSTLYLELYLGLTYIRVSPM